MNNKKVNRNAMLVKTSDNEAKNTAEICKTIRFTLTIAFAFAVLYVLWSIFKTPNTSMIEQTSNSLGGFIERILSALSINKIADFIPWSGWVGIIVLTIYIKRGKRQDNFYLEITSKKEDKTEV